MCKPQMSTTDKYWYIKEHWEDYEKHMQANNGSAVGFKFPDGSMVEATDDDLVVY